MTSSAKHYKLGVLERNDQRLKNMLWSTLIRMRILKNVTTSVELNCMFPDDDFQQGPCNQPSNRVQLNRTVECSAHCSDKANIYC